MCIGILYLTCLYTILYTFIPGCHWTTSDAHGRKIIKNIDLKRFYGLFRMCSDELVVPIIGVEPTTFALRKL
ncbi:hypothetical protein F6Q07_21400 [Pectobacterium parmentieri]|nr:hypothetical protein C5E19_17205 [Pectobacterium parmentieri]MBI0520656.1 hypothetical protein [Pectobacterium parmentieri]